MHVDEEVLAPLRERFGTPAQLPWEGEITDLEWSIATHNPSRTHDVTLFILDPSRRIALIRKPHFAAGVWRPPGGGLSGSVSMPARARSQEISEFEFHMSPVRSSSRPHTGVGTDRARSRIRSARTTSEATRIGLDTA